MGRSAALGSFRQKRIGLGKEKVAFLGRWRGFEAGLVASVGFVFGGRHRRAQPGRHEGAEEKKDVRRKCNWRRGRELSIWGVAKVAKNRGKSGVKAA